MRRREICHTKSEISCIGYYYMAGTVAFSCSLCLDLSRSIALIGWFLANRLIPRIWSWTLSPRVGRGMTSILHLGGRIWKYFHVYRSEMIADDAASYISLNPCKFSAALIFPRLYQGHQVQSTLFRWHDQCDGNMLSLHISTLVLDQTPDQPHPSHVMCNVEESVKALRNVAGTR